MTKQRALEILLNETLEDLDYFKPMNLSLNECVEAAVGIATGEELDIIGEKHFNLRRTGGTPLYGALHMGCSDPETDESYAKRILDHLDPPDTYQYYATNVNAAMPCKSHTWKHYHGFTESYDYCTKCDEKRK